MIKGIIFDFDGVIVESIQLKTDAFAQLFSKYGDNVVQKVIEHHESNGGISRYEKIRFYYESFVGRSIDNNEVLQKAEEFSELVLNNVILSPYVPGILKYIQNSYNNYKLFISTGTPLSEIIQILKGRNIYKYFTAIYGSPDQKIEHINAILASNNFNQNELLFYGDSITDFDAAKTYNIDFILRLHNKNKNDFKNYDGKIIHDFNNMID